MVFTSASSAWLPHNKLQVGLACMSFALLLIFTLLRPGMESGAFIAGKYVSEIRIFAYLGLFLAALPGAITNRDIGRLVAVPWLMLPALAWCWFSLTWSAAPNVSVKKLVLTTIVVWLASYCTRRIGYNVAVYLLRIILVAFLAANIIAVIFYPEIGVHSFEKAGAVHQWRGFMGHKNIAGLASGIIIILFLFDAKRINPIVRWAIISLATLFIIESHSRTSIWVTIIGSMVGALISVGYYRISSFINNYSKIINRGLLVLWLLLLIVTLWFSFHVELIQEAFQDPDALSGRAEIWQPMLQFYADHPVAGAGFGSYWLSSERASGGIDYNWLQSVSQGHNGYLDIAVQVGFVGLVAILIACVAMPVAIIYRMIGTRHASRRTIALLSALLVVVLGQNFSESSLFDRDTLGQVILLIVIGMLVTVSERSHSGRARRGSANISLKTDMVRRRRTRRIPVSTLQESEE